MRQVRSQVPRDPLIARRSLAAVALLPQNRRASVSTQGHARSGDGRLAFHVKR
jgi:hypothetical protein